MTTTIFDRTKKSSQANNPSGAVGDPAVFNSTGIAEVTDAELFLRDNGGLEIVGVPNLKVSLDVQGDATTTYTVPSGKQWRILTMILEVISDGSAGNRTVTVVTPGTTYVLANQAASTTLRSQIVFADNTQGNLRVEPVGTLTLATQVTAGDTMTINGVLITFVAVGSITANSQIEIGASEAATKVNINAALGDTRTAGNHSITDAIHASLDVTGVDFTGGGADDNMLFTYAGAGSATGDGEALTTAETFTNGGNVFDAATLGATTAGVGAGTKEGTKTFPADGVILDAADAVVITEPGLGDTGDDIDIYFTYIEYDETIT